MNVRNRYLFLNWKPSSISDSAEKQDERKNMGDEYNSSDEWDNGITFTVNPASKCCTYFTNT